MPDRDFTDKDLEEIGWNLVDRMLAMSQPQPTGQSDIGLRLRGLRLAALRRPIGTRPAAGGGIPRVLGVPEMLSLPKIEKEAEHGYRP